MSAASLLPLPPLELAASRAQCPCAAVLPRFLPDPETDRRDSAEGTGIQTSLVPHALGRGRCGGWADIRRQECVPMEVTPGWDSRVQYRGSCPGSWDCSSLWGLGSLASSFWPSVSLSVKWSEVAAILPVPTRLLCRSDYEMKGLRKTVECCATVTM